MERGRPRIYASEKERLCKNAKIYYYKHHELNLKRAARNYIIRKLKQTREEGKDETEIMNKLRLINNEINQIEHEAKNINQ